MLPLVSIIIPCYNHENYIADTIESVIKQTYQKIELIIIDDGSQDGSKVVIEEVLKVCSTRFERVFFNSRPNKGLCITINEALKICKGKYISLIASDDIMLPEKTAIQVAYLEKHTDVTGVFSAVEMINDKNQVIGQRISNKTEFSFEDIILNHHDLPTLTQMFHLTDIVSSGGYDEQVKIEDWYMLLKLSSLNKKIKYLPNILCQYRIHEGSFSNNKLLMATEMKKIIQPYRDRKVFIDAEFKIDKSILKHSRKDKTPFVYYLLKYQRMIKYWFEKYIIK